VTLQKIKATPGMTGAGFYQSVIIAAWINNTKKPFRTHVYAAPYIWRSTATPCLMWSKR